MASKTNMESKSELEMTLEPSELYLKNALELSMLDLDTISPSKLYLENALELSMLDLDTPSNNPGKSEASNAYGLSQEDRLTRNRQSRTFSECVDLLSEHLDKIFGARGQDPMSIITGRHEDVAAGKREVEDASKHIAQFCAGQITLSVPVPSSDHLAEIIGRKGYKIKALRARTHTCIKASPRGEDPMFFVSGKPEDVAAAKRELEDAEAFVTYIRAARRRYSMEKQGMRSLGFYYGSFDEDGLKRIPGSRNLIQRVAIPREHIAEIVGRGGCHIKALSEKTDTFIKSSTPPDDPFLLISGRPEDVAEAKLEVLAFADHMTVVRQLFNISMKKKSALYSESAYGLFEEDGLIRIPGSENIGQCVALPSREHLAKIVGRQGWKIQALQASTNTYIQSSSRDEPPMFIITGRPENVVAAKREVVAAADQFTEICAARRNTKQSYVTYADVGSSTRPFLKYNYFND